MSNAPIRIAMHGDCLVTYTYRGRTVQIQNKIHEFDQWRVATTLEVPTGDRTAKIIGNGIVKPTTDYRGCFGMVRVLCQYSPGDSEVYLICKPHDSYAEHIMAVTGSIPGARVELVPRMLLVGAAVPYDSVPEELFDNARDTALWIVTTLCGGFDKAAIVSSMHV